MRNFGLRTRKLAAVVAVVLTIGGLAVPLVNFGIADAVRAGTAQSKPSVIRLDYAYYSPLSLVLKHERWAEQTFAKEGIRIQWVLDQGSNTAIQYLDGNSIDFGTTAGGAAEIAKAKGSSIESVYVVSKPNWTALATNPSTGIKSVRDLKGKKVAVTIGTDPYIFLVRALKQAGLSINDVQVVNLQHKDGAAALVRHQVDAWAGLDPYLAKLQLQDGVKLIYSNPNYNTFALLNVRDAFAAKYPNYVTQVLQLYEKARLWTLSHPKEALKIVETEANLDPPVAKLVLSRNDFTHPVPDVMVKQTLIQTGNILKEAGILPSNVNVANVVNGLLKPTYSQSIVKTKR
ncbi:MAG: aliphatic sulfonate ABC transporter substrate-binding protein [Alicyclobacillaceae bacterium]|nr:aliphatic sulfonate ABC transporter substrate-binding protein [Alicyclobacillaceae bacterium]